MSLIIPESNRFDDRMMNSDLVVTNPGEVKMREQASPHGKLFQVLGTFGGKRIVKEIACNTVVVGGAITAMENLTGVSASWKPSTLNEIYSVSATASGAPKIALFGVGTGGANLEFGSVVAPSIKQRDVISPIPIRYGASVTGGDAAKYFMKVANEGGTTYSWYLKEFASTPTLKSLWKNGVGDADGTEITSEIYNSTNTEGIETFAEFEINLNTADVREYYEATGSISTARYNTFGFYTGSKNAEGTEYGDVRLYSVITFNNRSVELSSTSNFLYRVYSMI